MSLYDAVGGAAGVLRLAHAHHERCLADPELNHPFSHAGQHPQHVERLAAYWGEVWGGPPAYTSECGSQTDLIKMHSGNGGLTDLNQRFVDCFVAAFDDAGVPADPELRTSLRSYMEWAVQEFDRYPADASAVPANLPVPRWSWTGAEPALD